jgi:hypothetical protein
VLERSSGYVDRLLKEAIEKKLNKNDFNINGFMMSQAGRL